MSSTYIKKRLPTLVTEDLREQHETLQDELESYNNQSSFHYDDYELITQTKRRISNIRNTLRKHLVFVMERVPDNQLDIEDIV